MLDYWIKKNAFKIQISQIAHYFKILAGEGLELYYRIVKLLDEQHKNEKHGIMFEGQLRKKWKEKMAGRKRQREDGDGGEETPRAPNHLRLFLESKGLS